ncbi:acyl-CoA synthetase [Conexibacter sp. SYSU D00693]|uniref:acyl-CoA synthetase n=1 Tax=Conexibacter sp. SYSU D00693 TaxID=2812560 RepID=UPI00196A4C17|nr:acyl-CoA synthetase [Conexibacter sp. SYSU D00693]
MRRTGLAYVMAATGESVSHDALDRRSNRLAHLLRSRGLQTGDGIAILMENHPRFLEVAWAAQRTGLYYTAISTRLRPAEVAYVLADCAARALVTTPRMAEVAVPAAAQAPALETRLVCGPAADGFEAYDVAVAGRPEHPVDDEAQGIDLLYSAGTTGRPKGVRFPLPDAPPGSPTAFDRLVGPLYGVHGSSVYLSAAPLYHAAPFRFSMSALRCGAAVVVLDRFDAEEFLRAVERHRVTHTQVVPTMLVRLLALDPSVRARYDLRSLRCVVHAGAPCPPAVKEAAIEWLGPIVHEYYAGTERNGFVAATSEDWLHRPGTVGRAVIGRVHIVDEAGRDLPAGEVGKVFFEGGNAFEYLNAPEQTAASRHPSGWTTMGDMGHLDEDGYLYLADRQAHVIITGGVNVYPKEVEDLLAEHPHVDDAAVVGISHPEMGEEVKAVVQPTDMALAGSWLEAELIAFCRQRMASYKCPRSVEFVRRMPREDTGKLRKHLLLEDRRASAAP